MSLRLAVIGITLASVLPVLAEDRFDWHALEAQGEERAVLVLCPGMNQDGAFFLEEAAWMEFAERHDLGVIALAFRSDPADMYDETREGYYWPEQGSGDALLDAIRETFGGDLPIYIYGYYGGAQFTSRFVEWVPKRIVAWAAYSAQFWDSPHPSETNPPGIVACGDYDGVRWQPSFAYFYEGRALGKPWLWINLEATGHVRHGAFEAFVRRFFQSADIDAKADRTYVDVDTGETVESASDVLQPELLAVLPEHSLLDSWRAIHAR